MVTLGETTHIPLYLAIAIAIAITLPHQHAQTTPILSFKFIAGQLLPPLLTALLTVIVRITPLVKNKYPFFNMINN